MIFLTKANPNVMKTFWHIDLHYKASPASLHAMFKTQQQQWTACNTISTPTGSHSYVDGLFAEFVSFKHVFAKQHKVTTRRCDNTKCKVLRQRCALGTNGHFRVLSASNMGTKLKRHLCHSCFRKKTEDFWPSVWNWIYGRSGFSDTFFSSFDASAQRSKTCCGA